MEIASLSLFSAGRRLINLILSGNWNGKSLRHCLRTSLSFCQREQTHQFSSVQLRRVSTLVWNEISIEEVLNIEEQSDRLDENQRDPHGQISVSRMMFLNPSHSRTDGKLHDHRQKAPWTEHSQRHADQILQRREEKRDCQVQRNVVTS